MNDDLYNELLNETIALAEEEDKIENAIIFSEYIKDMLPIDILNTLININGSSSFLEEIWDERFKENDDNEDDGNNNNNFMKSLNCEICERYVKLTRHHLFPRETHKNCVKRGIPENLLSKTISICKMCHATIHRFFSNDELSKSYYSLELLLEEEKIKKYAKWAASQGNRLSKIR